MKALTPQEVRWIKEGIEAVNKLANVIAMTTKDDIEPDEETEELATMGSQLENIAYRIEVMLD